MRIGVIGGTFDPIHNGHLTIAGTAYNRLELDTVIFVPGARVRLRITSPVVTGEQRAEMVRLALAGRTEFQLSRVDLERAGPTRTVDTLTDLREHWGDADWYFIIGQDLLEELPRWWRPERLIELCRLAVLPRPGIASPDPAWLEAAVPGITGRLVWLDEPGPDISATDIRERISRGRAIDGLVPPPVAEYIAEHGLYRWDG
jgi:nicotinate-nucleotide adenylyltransferase